MAGPSTGSGRAELLFVVSQSAQDQASVLTIFSILNKTIFIDIFDSNDFFNPPRPFPRSKGLEVQHELLYIRQNTQIAHDNIAINLL